MEEKQKTTVLCIALCIVLFIILGIRSYGYYTDDQMVHFYPARQFAQNGKLSTTISGDGTFYGNFHPPLMIMMLGIFMRITTVLFAPVLLHLFSLGATLLLLLKIQRKIINRIPHPLERVSLVILFFLIPFTHQMTLYVDVDNTVLCCWSALFLLGLYNASYTPRYFAMMGLIFALGLWCKLTTPFPVFFVWTAIVLTENFRLKTVLYCLCTAVAGGGVFLATYYPVTLVTDIPFAFPFQITFSKFFIESSGSTDILFRAGQSLRAIFYDMHWLSFLFLPLVIVRTIGQLRSFSWKRQELTTLYPLIFFWALYLGYTFIVPTKLFPRYKYSLMPMVVIWLWEPFHSFLMSLKRRNMVLLGAVSILAIFIVPDLPTSALRQRLWYHDFALVTIPLSYDSPLFSSVLSVLAEWSESVPVLVPLRLIFFGVHYLSILGLIIFCIHLLSVLLIYLKTRHIYKSLFIPSVVVWVSLFAQNMSHEYRLFFNAGAEGFAQTVTYLKKNVPSEKKLCAYRDFGFYSGHKSYDPYIWTHQGFSLDTTRIDRIITTDKAVSHIAYIKNDFYEKNRMFTMYLFDHCMPVYSYADYCVWKIIR
jgi:hypothetical protein